MKLYYPRGFLAVTSFFQFKQGGMGEKLDMPEGEHRWDCPNLRLELQPSVRSTLSQYFSFKKHLGVEFLWSWGNLAL